MTLSSTRAERALADRGWTPRTQAFIDGSYVDALGGQSFECRSSIDGGLIAMVTAGQAVDADRAVHAARRAFSDGRWRRQPPAARKRTLLAFADLVEAHAEELAFLETLDTGKPIRDSRKVDLPAAVNTLRWYAESVDKVYGETAPTAPDALAFITREPVGVAAAIVPWNFPLYLAARKLGPGLAAGNSMILKPAEQSPLTALRIAGLASEAGLPDGVLNVLPGDGPTTGRALARHPDVDTVSFTGSTEVGRLMLSYAGESNLKRVHLECGGKTPQIVMADAPDLDTAAHAAAWGIFFNQGQVCNAASRLLVQRSIKDDFLDRVVDIARRIRLGNPLDETTELGALIDAEQTERVLRHVEAGVAEGATLRCGGTRALVDTGGHYVAPTVFDGVTTNMSIAQQEIFGPVLSTLAFDTVDEAVRIANDSSYGLSAAVWSRDIDTALGVADVLRAGTVWVNNFDDSDITTPWGGFKQSGNGREKSLHAFDEYTEVKTTWIHRPLQEAQ